MTNKTLQESQEEYEDDYDQNKNTNKKKNGVGFIPCRRICSTVHNPAFHQARYGGYNRISSADASKRRRQEKMNMFDWSKSEINQYINIARFDIDQSN